MITRILAEGASAGIHLVMTGDRSLLAGRIAALCEDKLVFRLAERDDYALAGLRSRDLPGDIPPGRAFGAGTGTETQVALLAPDPSGQGQAAALRQTADWAAALDAAVPPARRPFRVDLLPARITFADAWNLRPRDASPLWGLVGVGGDELMALGPDLSDGTPAFIVAGPPRSGRSAVLASMTRSFLAGGAQVILVTPRPSPLRSLASLPGTAAVFAQSDLGEDELAAAIASLTAPGAVVIDDADLLSRLRGRRRAQQDHHPRRRTPPRAGPGGGSRHPGQRVRRLAGRRPARKARLPHRPPDAARRRAHRRPPHPRPPQPPVSTCPRPAQHRRQ